MKVREAGSRAFSLRPSPRVCLVAVMKTAYDADPEYLDAGESRSVPRSRKLVDVASDGTVPPALSSKDIGRG